MRWKAGSIGTSLRGGGRGGGSADAAVRPEARRAQVHVRRRGPDAPHRAGNADRHLDGRLLRRRGDAARPAAEQGPAGRARQPADGTVLRRRRRAGRHARDPHREARAGPRLRHLVAVSRVRRAQRHRPHGDAPAGPARDASGSTRSTAARSVARTRSSDGKRSWEVPLAPFLGCLGVSPPYGEARSTIVPDNFGGNMDCPEVRAGNTVYLGVRVPGALLSFGDGHYAHGRRRDHRDGDRGGDERRAHRRAHQGPRDRRGPGSRTPSG